MRPRFVAQILLVVALVAASCSDDTASTTAAITEPVGTAAPATTQAPPAATATTQAPATTTAPATTVAVTSADGCSASGMSLVLDQPELGRSVDVLRRDIIEAATLCDYERLELLASRAELFTDGEPEFIYSFGVAPGSAGFAAFLMEYEGFGNRPLATLVNLLNTPFALTVDDDGSPQYVWPSAAGYEDWASVPQADRDAISGLYSPEDFEVFDLENAYFGGRVGITDISAVWSYFILGGD